MSTSPTLRDIGEDALVQRLTQTLPQGPEVIIGPGDDCALVTRPASDLLLKADAIVQDVHFTLDTDPRLIGRKALARAISDIGAMGGVPKHALVTIVLPPQITVAFVESIYAGMAALAEDFGVSIVGGETSQGAQLMLSVALTGEAQQGSIRRSEARAGDALFVTGRLGGSITGKHLTFVPRVAQARWLIETHRPSAMMDLSDGLAKDLPRLAKASALDFVVNERVLPCTPGCTASQAWGDGEDYELLFAMPADSSFSLIKEWSAKFPELELTQIGSLVAEGDGHAPSFATSGWEHFRTR